jgi:LmbE family N-acetylglucosaminyl deacetylase
VRYLYIFPHPDDESYGPAVAMSKQLREGSEVHLLTLTRGGATKRRHELGLSVAEMGEVRYREMLDVERTLGLSGMRVLDFPDSALKEMDPRVLERAIRDEIMRLRPDVVVAYAVFGVSGFEDHLVAHAVAKRAYVELRDEHPDWLRRLALFTVNRDDPALKASPFGLRGSKPEDIDCVVRGDEEDVAALHRALDCYVTYQRSIEESGVREIVGRDTSFEIFGETHRPPLSSLDEGLDG